LQSYTIKQDVVGKSSSSLCSHLGQVISEVLALNSFMELSFMSSLLVWQQTSINALNRNNNDEIFMVYKGINLN
jgi:hypothetical protein